MEHDDAPLNPQRLTRAASMLRHDTAAWQHTQPVALLHHLLRLTAPNAGIMTGPGTNTYLIGDRASGFIVLDPGPDEPLHLQRILLATGGDVRHIVCTHSHPDHAPGAWPLQQLVQQAGQATPPVAGMASGPHARPDSRFTPQLALRTGDEIRVMGAGQTYTLRAIHTPGHAANHLCFLLVEDALLFSGDHILGGSTSVVLPPDGSMQDYLDALDTLDATCAAHAVACILPAHGHVLADARGVIAQLKAHRLGREARVLAAIESRPDGTVEEWLAHAYADTPQALWPVARYSLLAHVQRLAALHPELGLQRLAMPARVPDLH